MKKRIRESGFKHRVPEYPPSMENGSPTEQTGRIV